MLNNIIKNNKVAQLFNKTQLRTFSQVIGGRENSKVSPSSNIMLTFNPTGLKIDR